ncbi:metallophosphoesterase [Pseudomonas sp. o96-267]|nr:metallophosphoesterase family protein [Pseudomonas sp. o96-267]RRV28001.1 metallophosphoesterase [Pseudomonas sp. o96-267]
MPKPTAGRLPRAAAWPGGSRHARSGWPHILTELERIAPLSVVRGNNDQEAWADDIPETLTLRFEDTTLYVLHDLKQLNIDPRALGIDVVIAGHSHKPLHEERNGVLYLNPGSAGPRRFKLPIGVGILHIEDGRVQAELITLPV